MTPATSPSLRAASIIPRLTNIGPPGSAKALISRTFTTSKEYLNSECWRLAGIAETSLRPTPWTYDWTESSRKSGNCCRASAAACCPIWTSCAGVYLLSGGVTGVWADKSAVESAATMTIKEGLELMWRCFCKNRPVQGDAQNAPVTHHPCSASREAQRRSLTGVSGHHRLRGVLASSKRCGVHVDCEGAREARI